MYANVQSRSADSSLYECLVERVFIHQHAPRSVDHYGARLHQRETLSVDEAVVLRIARSVHAQVVTATKQVLQAVHQLHIPAMTELQIGIRLIRQNLHLKTRCALSHALAYAAQTGDSERFPPHVLSGGSGPRASTRDFIQLDDAASHRQHQAEGEVRNRPVIRSLRGGDQHTRFRRRGDVDRFETDAPTRNVLQRVGSLDDRACVSFSRRRNHSVITLDQLHDVLFERTTARPAVGPDVPASVAQGREPRIVGAGHPGRRDEYIRHRCSIRGLAEA